MKKYVLIIVIGFASICYLFFSNPLNDSENQNTIETKEEKSIENISDEQNGKIIKEKTLDNEKNTTEIKDKDVQKNNDNSNLPSGEDGKMIRLINQKRKENVLNELTYDPNLYTIADARLEEVSRKFSHTRPNGEAFYTISSVLDGENLARYGAGDAQSTFTGFMHSKGHRENILYSGFTRVACKKAIFNGNVYWIQLFGY